MLKVLVRQPGRVSSAALAASGIGIAVQPQQATRVLRLSATSSRGIAEIRAGLGGTFAALGLWALARGSKDAYRAVGLTWLGAAAVRTMSLRVDEPELDWTFWGFLGAEVLFGVAGVVAGPPTYRSPSRTWRRYSL
ncbi:MAG: DUF4345 family protein [Actinomycetes bacterium]